MATSYFENGQYKGYKDDEGRLFDDKNELIGVFQEDGSFIDFKNSSIWRPQLD